MGGVADSVITAGLRLARKVDPDGVILVVLGIERERVRCRMRGVHIDFRCFVGVRRSRLAVIADRDRPVQQFFPVIRHFDIRGSVRKGKQEIVMRPQR